MIRLSCLPRVILPMKWCLNSTFLIKSKKKRYLWSKIMTRCGLIWSFGFFAFNLFIQFAKQPILVRYSSKPFYSSIICIYKQFLCLKKCSPEIHAIYYYYCPLYHLNEVYVGYPYFQPFNVTFQTKYSVDIY